MAGVRAAHNTPVPPRGILKDVPGRKTGAALRGKRAAGVCAGSGRPGVGTNAEGLAATGNKWRPGTGPNAEGLAATSKGPIVGACAGGRLPGAEPDAEGLAATGMGPIAFAPKEGALNEEVAAPGDGAFDEEDVPAILEEEGAELGLG